jgi:hypothetical protein
MEAERLPAARAGVPTGLRLGGLRGEIGCPAGLDLRSAAFLTSAFLASGLTQPVQHTLKLKDSSGILIYALICSFRIGDPTHIM